MAIDYPDDLSGDGSFPDRADKFFSSLSSCGAWRNQAHATLTGPVEDIPPKLQLLTHPILWGEKPGTRWDRLATWEANQKKICQKSVDRVTEIWRNHSGVAEHDNR